MKTFMLGNDTEHCIMKVQLELWNNIMRFSCLFILVTDSEC